MPSVYATLLPSRIPRARKSPHAAGWRSAMVKGQEWGAAVLSDEVQRRPRPPYRVKRWRPEPQYKFERKCREQRQRIAGLAVAGGRIATALEALDPEVDVSLHPTRSEAPVLIN